MTTRVTLDAYLTTWAHEHQSRANVPAIVQALAGVAIELSALLSQGALVAELSRPTGNAASPEQKAIDVLANDKVATALEGTGVAALASEEMDEPLVLDPSQPLLVAVDPLDGSSNIDANASVGLIFTVLPRNGLRPDVSAFLQPGRNQLTGGFFVFGPQTSLAVTLGSGTLLFDLDRASGTFIEVRSAIEIPEQTSEYAINTSNARHWDEPIRAYVHDVENGQDGSRGRDFNMRWTGSPVSDLYRVLARGGIYLYPGDRRKDFRDGRLRLIYEANPFAWVIEQAGGAASTGRERVLDIVPHSLHQRTPLIAGSRAEVRHVERLHEGLDVRGDLSPLFARRGLFRV